MRLRSLVVIALLIAMGLLSAMVLLIVAMGLLVAMVLLVVAVVLLVAVILLVAMVVVSAVVIVGIVVVIRSSAARITMGTARAVEAPVVHRDAAGVVAIAAIVNRGDSSQGASCASPSPSVTRCRFRCQFRIQSQVRCQSTPRQAVHNSSPDTPQPAHHRRPMDCRRGLHDLRVGKCDDDVSTVVRNHLLRRVVQCAGRLARDAWIAPPPSHRQAGCSTRCQDRSSTECFCPSAPEPTGRRSKL